MDWKQKLEEYIAEKKGNFSLLSVSTNKVSRFSFEGKDYILKEQHVKDDALSPFWAMMKEFFHSDFSAQRRCMGETLRLLSENPQIPVPRLVLSEEAGRYQVFEAGQGLSWEPDEFPDSAETAFQLGRYVGSLHRAAYPSCGLPGGEKVPDIKERMRTFIIRRAEEDWKDALSGRVCRFAEKLLAAPVPVSRYVLMMADISGNQFLFDGERISACVDFDAYVIGPGEWELSILKDCVRDWGSFQRGYEEYLPLPELDAAERFYLFLMKLGEPWDLTGMEALLDRWEA